MFLQQTCPNWKLHCQKTRPRDTGNLRTLAKTEKKTRERKDTPSLTSTKHSTPNNSSILPYHQQKHHNEPFVSYVLVKKNISWSCIATYLILMMILIWMNIQIIMHIVFLSPFTTISFFSGNIFPLEQRHSTPRFIFSAPWCDWHIHDEWRCKRLRLENGSGNHRF